MNINIRKMNQNIRSGIQLEENIPQLLNRLADDYHTMAMVRLALNYFTLYEAYCDDEYSWSKDIQDIVIRLNKLIESNILTRTSGHNREGAIREVDTLRKEIMKRMDLLTAYTDVFETYEYVLNRVEYRFRDNLLPVEGEEFARDILRYIFDSEDNVIINDKIREIIGQLPIRITRQKYFDLLNQSMQTYLGADQSSFDSYLYMLRTSTMLYEGEGMDTCYPALWEKKEFLSRLKYQDISKEQYDQAILAIQSATISLETESTVYLSLAELVNDIYVILLCAPYIGFSGIDMEDSGSVALSIIQDINPIYLLMEKQELSKEFVDKFTDLEGVQEALSMEFNILEEALYVVQHQHCAITKSLMLEHLLQVLLRSQKLMSESLFIDLDEMPSEEKVNEAMISAASSQMEEALSAFFASHDKMINRAVMANILRIMPVFFDNHKEVMEYVRYSVERCSDAYEKSACYEIINEIINE
jgi:hypothetical protein